MRKMNHLKSNLLVSEKGPLEKDILNELMNESWERNFYPGQKYEQMISTSCDTNRHTN